MPQPPPPSDCVAWWTFDDTPGPVAYDYADNFAADLTWDGGPSSKTIYAQDWIVRPGYTHKAAVVGDYDGDGVDNFLTCAKPGWDAEMRSAAFTVGAWIELAALPSAGEVVTFVDTRVVTTDEAGVRSKKGYDMYMRGVASQRQLCAAVGNGGPDEIEVCRDAPGVTAGTFAHVAVVFPSPGAGGPCSISLDGVPLGGPTAMPPWDMAANPTLYVGKNVPASEGGAFRGRLDDLMMFSRALTAEEIAGIAAAGPGGMGPAAPLYFDTDLLRVGVDDELAPGNAEPVDPGPILSARAGCCADLDGDGVGFFGHRFTPKKRPGLIKWISRIAGVPTGPDPALLIEIYPEGWKPGDPYTQTSVPLNSIWSPRSNESYIGTLDLATLPDGDRVIAAWNSSSAIDVSVTGATVDFLEFEQRLQKAPPRDFGVEQIPFDGTQLTSTPEGLKISPRNAASGLATGKKTADSNNNSHIQRGDPVWRTVVQFPPGTAGDVFKAEASYRVISAGPGGGPHVRRGAIGRGRQNGSVVFADYDFVLEADTDGDGTFTRLTPSTIEVFNAGALVYSGPATLQTHVASPPRDTMACAGGPDMMSLSQLPTRISLTGLPPGSPVVENVVATDVRMRWNNDPYVEDATRLTNRTVSCSSGSFTVLEESLGVPHPAAGDGTSVGRSRAMDIKYVGVSTNASARGKGIVKGISHPLKGLAINSDPPRRVPPLASAGGSLQLELAIGENPLYNSPGASGVNVLYEAPNRRASTTMATWASSFRYRVNSSTGEIYLNSKMTEFGIREQGVGYADGDVGLAVDFDEIGGSGYFVRGFDDAGALVSETSSDSVLPNIILDNFASKHAINTKGTGGNRLVVTLEWTGRACPAKINGASVSLRRLEISPLTQSIPLSAIIGIDDDCDDIERLGILEARGILLPAVQKRVEIRRDPSARNVPRYIVKADGVLRGLQEAAQLNGPWRNVPGAEASNEFVFDSADPRHFFRLADPSVPAEPAP